LTAKTKIRLIHTSDTHLGDGWRDNRTEAAFARVVDSVLHFNADALLVVGDVFDHARVPDRALEFYLTQTARLDRPVVTLPGNHDLYHHDSLYRREPFRHAPANFHLFTGHAGETITLPELGLDLWGRAMTDHTPDFRPLAGMPAARAERWLVGLAHAHFHFPSDTENRSSPIWPTEVAEAPCHYLALGHWERHVDVSQGSTAAYYSGSPLGSAPDNNHISVNLVDLDPHLGVTVRQAMLPLGKPAPLPSPSTA
jgi:DNA repair exonuclease SbcCD nuclease subunit